MCGSGQAFHRCCGHKFKKLPIKYCENHVVVSLWPSSYNSSYNSSYKSYKEENNKDVRVLQNAHAALSWNGKFTCHLAIDILYAYVDGGIIDPDVFTRVVRRPRGDNLRHVPVLLLVPAPEITHAAAATATKVVSVPRTALLPLRREGQALVKSRPAVYEGVCKYVFRTGSIIKDDLYVRVDYKDPNHAVMHVGHRSAPTHARISKLEVRQQIVGVQFLQSDTIVIGIRDKCNQYRLYLWNFVSRQVTARSCIAVHVLHVHLDHFSLLQRVYHSPMVIVCSKREAQLILLNSDETTMLPVDLVSDIRCVASSVAQENVLYVALGCENGQVVVNKQIQTHEEWESSIFTVDNNARPVVNILIQTASSWKLGTGVCNVMQVCYENGDIYTVNLDRPSQHDLIWRFASSKNVLFFCRYKSYFMVGTSQDNVIAIGKHNIFQQRERDIFGVAVAPFEEKLIAAVVLDHNTTRDIGHLREMYITNDQVIVVFDHYAAVVYTTATREAEGYAEAKHIQNVTRYLCQGMVHLHRYSEPAIDATRCWACASPCGFPQRQVIAAYARMDTKELARSDAYHGRRFKPAVPMGFSLTLRNASSRPYHFVTWLGYVYVVGYPQSEYC